MSSVVGYALPLTYVKLEQRYSRDEVRCATNIAKLPELLRKP